MKALVRTALVGLALLGIGCSLFVEKETQYLQSAEGRANREDVQGRLGRPYLVAATQSGDPVWVYQIRTAEKGGNGNWSIIGFWCDEYVLTFDRQGILKSWTHKSQKHRDDRQPASCVPDGFEPAS
ncbi:MAG TPA: hypothetical protein VGQ60_04135 [Nitrospiraceae bacterium]|nr:hypothetical protein [Nitrospiraceae bacterium]